MSLSVRAPRYLPETSALNEMALVPGGSFKMGSDLQYSEEAPAHRVSVDAFLMDRTSVTNRQFEEFVEATGHVTFAEIPPDRAACPWIPPDMLFAGSLVLSPPEQSVKLRDRDQCWTFLKGADWRHPYGLGSSINGLEDHPVVHVAYGDARAYARWVGKNLPSEAEWVLAVHGGQGEAKYARGEELAPSVPHDANPCKGQFPRQDFSEDGYKHTSQVTSFFPNAYGLYDMVGNVWQWTSDRYSPKHQPDAAKTCCTVDNPRGGPEAHSVDQRQAKISVSRKILKGGPNPCAPNCRHCSHPSTSHLEATDISASHTGFRCVIRKRISA